MYDPQVISDSARSTAGTRVTARNALLGLADVAEVVAAGRALPAAIPIPDVEAEANCPDQAVLLK